MGCMSSKPLLAPTPHPSTTQEQPPTQPSSSSATNHESTTFYTSSLRPERNEVRLLMILPAVDLCEIVHVSLSVVSLDDKPEYEALSYVWGDPTDTRMIHLNGKAFSATVNLWSALRRLRGVDEPRIFWIDAICINQKDLAERGSQVSLMARIYSECTLCTVWLGEDTATTGEAFDTLESMASGVHVDRWSRSIPLDVRPAGISSNSATGAGDFVRPKRRTFGPLRAISTSPWWTRTWTLQEIILPPVALLKCGQYELDWGVIESSQISFFAHIYDCCKDLYNSLDAVDYHSLRKLAKVTLQLRGVRGDSPRGTSWSTTSEDMIRLLAGHREREATDPRDKVYALLSFCSTRIQQGLRADYTADLLHCYSWPVIDSILQSQSLRALCLAHLNQKSDLLPSWVPDWSRSSQELICQYLRFEYHDLYSAGGSSKLSQPTRHGGRLSMEGVRQDAILHVGSFAVDFDDNTVSVIHSWLELWKQTTTQSDLTNSEEDDIHIGPFLRTLLRDVSLDRQKKWFGRSTEEEYKTCKRWWDLAGELAIAKLHELAGDKEETRKLEDIEYSLGRTISSSRFFITDKGSIGLGPDTTEVGDEIWIICGSKMPLILRRQEGKPITEGERSGSEVYYQLVSGEPYVDGMMNGEAAWSMERESVPVHIV